MKLTLRVVAIWSQAGKLVTAAMVAMAWAALKGARSRCSSASRLTRAWILIEGRQQGWPIWLDVLLALSVPALTAFALLLQRRTSRQHGHPLIRWSLFGQRAFVIGSALSLVFFLGVAPFFFVFSVYLQTGLGFSALATGLTVLPFASAQGSPPTVPPASPNASGNGCSAWVPG